MSAVASESGKPTDVPRKDRTCLIVAIVLGVLAVIAAVVVAVVVTTSAAATIAAIAENATTGADGTTGDGSDSTTPGLTVKASFADLEGESFFADGRRRMEAPYGDANTTGSTASVKEITSFKVSPLQVVMCTEPPDSYEREGANTVMGVGVSNGAANILDQFDRFNCAVICGRDWK